MPQAPDHAPDRLPETPGQRVSLLRMSLAGEYTAILLMFHTGCGVLVWAPAAPGSACGLSLIAAGTWLVIRATGAWSGSWMTPLTTAGLALGLFSVSRGDLSNLPPFPVEGMFSPSVFLAILTVMFLVDLADCWLQFRRHGR
jgi:hypothetical protein